MTIPIPHNQLDPALLQSLADGMGLTIDEVTARLSSTEHEALTVAEHAGQYLRRLEEGTRRTFATAIKRFVYGYGPVCDSKCDPCRDPRFDFHCRCDCRDCQQSRITLPDISAMPVGPKVYNRSALADVSQVALRSALKRGNHENRNRAAKGLPDKRVVGKGAQESAISALRALFQDVKGLVDGYDGKDVKKPSKRVGTRRAFRDFELLELLQLTALGGDDPQLDTDLFKLGIHTGARREGAYELTIGQLRPETQMIRVKDKTGDEVDQPVSAELLEDLSRRAIERGGSQCDPNSPQYRPDAPVFYYRAGKGKYKPITSRRFDTLNRRWQKGLTWAAEEQVGYHHLRHTIAEVLKAQYGEHYAKRYLRHAPDSVTERYGLCTTEELARAMSELLEYEHPLVGSQDERRAEVHRRLGVE